MRAALARTAVLWLALPAGAADPPPAARNAALQYWVAFDQRPRHNDIPEAERTILGEWETIPLTPEVVGHLKRWQRSLVYLHRGAELPDCVWPSRLNFPRDGVGVLMPEQDARSLAAAACLRARYRFENNRPAVAVDDMFAALRLARHVGRGGGLLNLLIERAIENQAVRCLAGNLWAVNDPDLLQSLLKRWDALTQATTATDALAAERDQKVEWLETARSLVGSDAEPDLLGDRPTVPRAERLGTRKYALGLQLESGSVREFVTAVRRESGRAVEIARLPLDEMKAAEGEWRAGLEKNASGDDKVVHVFAALGAPQVYKFRLGDARAEALRAMLRAAVAAKLERADMLTARDPFGDGPFGFTRTEAGYELRSKLSDRLAEAAREKLMPDAPAVLAIRTVRPK